MSNNKAKLLKKSLLEFYKVNENLEKFSFVINNPDYSKRLIEWFCGNYSKKNNTIYNVNRKEFNVYISYKAYTDSYGKKQFDPYKRKYTGFPPFKMKCLGKVIVTTVCQLNFFKWFIMNNVIEYMKKNLTVIRNDMTLGLARYKDSSKTDTVTTKDEKTTRKKRQALSVSATKTCIKRYTPEVLEFV